MRHESMAYDQGQASLGGTPAHCWSIKRQSGSHRTLERPGWPDLVFAFHEGEEIGPRMLARIAKRSGLKPEDL